MTVAFATSALSNLFMVQASIVHIISITPVFGKRRALLATAPSTDLVFAIEVTSQMQETSVSAAIAHQTLDLLKTQFPLATFLNVSSSTVLDTLPTPSSPPSAYVTTHHDDILPTILMTLVGAISLLGLIFIIPWNQERLRRNREDREATHYQIVYLVNKL